MSDVAAISFDRMRSHAIACNRMKSQTLCRQLSEFLKMHREREVGQEVCLMCFFTTTVNRFHIIIFTFLKKEEMRSGTHFTQQNVFLLFTVVVTKHVWPYFQSRFPKTSSEHVSSCPASCSRCIFKNLDSRERKVFFRDRMRSHAIACDRM